MPRVRSIAIVALFGVILFPLLSSAGVEKARPKDPLKALVAHAKELRASGQVLEAEWAYRKLLFMNPGSRKLRKTIRELSSSRVDEILEEYEQLDPEENGWDRLRLLGVAFSIDPGHEPVRALYEGLGYRLVGSTWRAGDSIEVQQDQAAADQARARELELGDSYVPIRQGPLRFFTNMDPRKGRNLLRQVLDANATHLGMYRQLMEPFCIKLNDDLDIVFYGSRSEYMSKTKAEGTAGVYIPSDRAGFFYKDGSVNFPTMLHEMTHQYNDKILEITAHGWFEEGISEYFGAGFLSNQGRKMKLGLPDASRMTSFQMMVKHGARGEGEYMPLAEFTHAATELTSEFYAQAWALAYYLMEIDPTGRLVMFDYVAYHCGLCHEMGRGKRPQGFSLADALELNGRNLHDFEQQFLGYFRGESDPRKPSKKKARR